MRLYKRKVVITGCEHREGDDDWKTPYLTRYELIKCRDGMLCLHIFHRSDYKDFHDHPWNFYSLILWRGYIETVSGDEPFPWERTKRIRPLSILSRAATHRHRVDLIDGKKAITLVWMSKRVREWNFFTIEGPVNWRAYFDKLKCWTAKP